MNKLFWVGVTVFLMVGVAFDFVDIKRFLAVLLGAVLFSVSAARELRKANEANQQDQNPDGQRKDENPS